MSKFIIEGGHSLQREIMVSGAKNIALPILVSTLLTNESCAVTNVPDIADIHTLLDVLNSLRC